MSADTLTELLAGRLRGIRRLDLSARLTEAPPEILTLADSLEILNLSGNLLTHLPDWLPRLTKLRVLFCSENPFCEVPEILGKCEALTMVGFKSCQIETLSAASLPPRLRWLILTDNHLTELPTELGCRPALQKLMLSGNQLKTLPDSMAACGNLELLRLASNRFTMLPPWLTSLPRLAWLAIAGNPLTDGAAPDAAGFPAIPWTDLSLEEMLGEGASGQIFSAIWKSQDSQVAVKLFKGSMTSDGLPASETAASLTVAGHPALIGSLGRIADHPDGIPGLVMRRIAPHFQALAGPPSLETCTRDVYPETLSLTSAETVRMAQTMAAAGAHLHRCRVLHGDFYAHNILHAPGGEVLLGDFGAAASTASLCEKDERALQRVEVRAFGVLLGELLSRTAGQGTDKIRSALTVIQRRCADARPAERASFAEAGVELACLS